MRRSSTRCTLAIVVLASVTIGGCTSGAPPAPEAFVRYSSCDELLARLKSSGRKAMDEFRIVEPVGVPYTPVPSPGEDGGEGGGNGPAMLPPVSVPGAASAPERVASNPAVSVGNTDSSPRRGVLTYRPASGGTALHVSLPKADGYRVIASTTRAFAIGRQGDRIPESAPSFGGGSTTVVAIVDLTPATPRLTSTVRLEGTPLWANIIDGRLRIVLDSAGTRLHLRNATTKDKPKTISAENKRRIESSDIDRWLPHYVIEPTDGRPTTGTIVRCDRAYVPRKGAVTGALSVLSIDPERPDPRAAASVLGSRTGVDVRSDVIYIARSVPAKGSETTDRPSGGTTTITALSLVNDGTVLRSASGAVPGVLLDGWGERLNRWSISPDGDDVRVVTRDPDAGNVRTTLSVLRREGDRLNARGTFSHLGSDLAGIKLFERTAALIEFGSRPTGDTTLVDLADPDRPRRAGQIGVASYRTYFDAPTRDTLVTVTPRSEDKGSRTRIGLYDVHDPMDPRLVDEVTTKQYASGLAVFDRDASILDVGLRGADGHYRVDPRRGFTSVAERRPAVKPSTSFDDFEP